MRDPITRLALTAVTACAAPFIAGCSDTPNDAAPQASAGYTHPMMMPGQQGKPLEVGTKLPTLGAEGWLNGKPPSPKAPGVRLVVVDIWAHWCPYCRQGAPGLVKLYEKYHKQGVAFVSVTSMERQAVQAYVDEFAIPWPNGYGMDALMMVNLGINSGIPTRGYEVDPTLFLVDEQGKICWSDEQGRFRHQETAEWLERLDTAIAEALAKVPANKPAAAN